MPVSMLADGRLMRFKVSADARGPVSLAKMVFRLITSGVSLSNVRLYAFSDSQYSSPNPGQDVDGGIPTSNVGAYIVGPTSPIVIPAGQTRYFELRGSVSSVSSGGSVTTTLLSEPNGIKTIAARRIVKIDLAAIGAFHFISFVEFGITSNNLEDAGIWKTLQLISKPATKWQLKIDNSYILNIQGLGGLLVNSRGTSSKQERIANPTDGFLDLLLMEKMSKSDILKLRNILSKGQLEELPNPTVVKCKSVEFLEPRGQPVTMFGRQVAKFPTIAPAIQTTFHGGRF
jgi:hypothetical protein